jgi:hypothetical protein
LETFSYKVVERALAAVHHIPPNALGAFRGRLQHFQRLGVVPASPGRGRKIAYTKADVYLWALGLEFAEFGMDPKPIKQFLIAYFSTIRRDFLENDDDRKQFFFFSPSLLGKDFPVSLQQSLANPSGAPYCMAAVVISDLAELDTYPRTATAHGTLERHKSRYGLIDLRRLRTNVDAALSAASSESPSR